MTDRCYRLVDSVRAETVEERAARESSTEAKRKMSAPSEACRKCKVPFAFWISKARVDRMQTSHHNLRHSCNLWRPKGKSATRCAPGPTTAPPLTNLGPDIPLYQPDAKDPRGTSPVDENKTAHKRSCRHLFKPKMETILWGRSQAARITSL